MTVETFRCEVYACRLTRAACADRHRAAKRPPAVAYGPTLRWTACAGCAVGAAHARGEQPDVTIASVVARAQEVVMAQGKTTMVERGGVTKPLKEWAKEAGIKPATVHKRIASGASVEEALTLPVAPTDPRASSRRAAASTKAAESEPVTTIVAPPSVVPRRSPVASVADLLGRLGYSVTDLGEHPGGRLVLVGGAP